MKLKRVFLEKRGSLKQNKSNYTFTVHKRLLYKRELSLGPRIFHCGSARAIKDDVVAQEIKNKRLFSKLNPQSMRHEPGSLVGATLMIAGSAVGAGILALPQTTQAAGFACAAPALAGVAIYSAITGLLVAEVQLGLIAGSGVARPVSLLSLAEDTLGPPGALFSTAASLLSSYALLVAYISRGGSTISSMLHVPVTVSTIGFTGILAALVYTANLRQIEAINGVLVVGLLAAFLGLVTLALPGVDAAELLKGDWSAVPNTLPVIILTFVYHNVVPVVVNSLEGDPFKIRTSILLGSFIPLVMFVLWEAAVLGNIAGLPSGVDPLQALQASSSVFGPLVQLFTLLAVSTSFFSFALSLSDFLADLLKTGTHGRYPIPYTLTVIPPLGLALTYPDLFFSSLDVAGAFGMATLFGIMPATMAWIARSRSEISSDLGADSIYLQNTSLLPRSSVSTDLVEHSALGSQDLKPRSVASKQLEAYRRQEPLVVALPAPQYIRLVPGGGGVLLLVGGFASCVILHDIWERVM